MFCKHSLILLTAAADKVGIPLFLSSVEEAQRSRGVLSLVGVQTSCQMHTPASKPGDAPSHLQEVAQMEPEVSSMSHRECPQRASRRNNGHLSERMSHGKYSFWVSSEVQGLDALRRHSYGLLVTEAGTDPVPGCPPVPRPLSNKSGSVSPVEGSPEPLIGWDKG